MCGTHECERVREKDRGRERIAWGGKEGNWSHYLIKHWPRICGLKITECCHGLGTLSDMWRHLGGFRGMVLGETGAQRITFIKQALRDVSMQTYREL